MRARGAHSPQEPTSGNLCLQGEIKRAFGFESLVGSSDELRRRFRKVEQVAATDATALFLGEAGTGKELHARSIVVPRKGILWCQELRGLLRRQLGVDRLSKTHSV